MDPLESLIENWFEDVGCLKQTFHSVGLTRYVPHGGIMLLMWK